MASALGRRWELLLALLGVVLVPSGLAWARYVDSRGWINGLYVSAAGASLLLLAFVFVGVRRAAGRKPRAKKRAAGWAAAFGSVITGTVAASARIAILRWAKPPQPGPRLVVLWIIVARSVYVVFGASALLAGAFAVWEALSRSEAAEKRPRRAWATLFAGGLGITAGLYSLSSLGRLIGLGINHWTFISLLFLSAIAFGLAALIDRANR
jgi:hypothetical protein